MPSGGSGDTTTIQDIPAEFKPAFTSLFNSAFGAARTSAGQPGFPQLGGGGGATQLANAITGGSPLASGFGGSQFNPFGPTQQQAPTSNIGDSGQIPSQPSGGGGFQPALQSNLASTPTQTVVDPTGATSPPGTLDFGRNPFSDLPPFATGGIAGLLSDTQGPLTGTGGDIRGGSTQIPLAAGEPIIGPAFGEQFTAGTSPLEFESLARREQVGRDLQGLGNPLLNLGQFTAEGGFLNNNPFLQANIEASLRPAVENFTGSVLPAFGSQAIQSGAFKGSSARDLAFNQLAGGFGRNLADTAAQIGFQNFQGERQLQQQAGNLLSQGAQLSQITPEILSQVGLGQRELAQRPLDEALLQFQEGINAPFRPLFPLASIIQGGDIGSIFNTSVPQPSAVSQGIVGALGGAGVGGQTGDLFGQPGLGALLGGLAGGVGGGFGV